MPAWFWFVVALIAAAGGALLLLSGRSGSAGSSSRARRRWAEQVSWNFVSEDRVLPGRWRYGAVHQGGPGRAVDLASGAVPATGGRRLGHVFDHEQDGRVTGVVAAVRGSTPLPVALELRLPSGPRPESDAGLDSMGRVGERHAFVTNVLEARPLATDQVAAAADEVGEDVPLVWAEDTWVLADAPPGTDTERMQEILRTLAGLSVALERAMGVEPAEPGEAPSPADRNATEVMATEDPRRDADTETLDSGDTDTVDTARTTETARAGGPADPADPDDRDLDDLRGDGLDADDPDHTDHLERATDPSGPTHRDRPADVPYDVEADTESGGTGPGARSSRS